MKRSSESTTTRISSFVVLVVMITLVLSLLAVVLAVYLSQTEPSDTQAPLLLLAIGGGGLILSVYVLIQMRRRLRSLKIEIPPVNTTIECRKCGTKSVREFQRGDYIFKELEKCQKCDDKMVITAIYREVQEKEKERSPFLG